MFTREDGTELHPELASRTFDRLVRDADLPPLRLHDLRHGAATLALAAGVDLKVVSSMLRHSSITITADTYISVLPETARAAAEAAAAVVPRRSVPARTGRSGPTLVPHDLGERLWAPTPKGKDRGHNGCAARDLNPEPAD